MSNLVNGDRFGCGTIGSFRALVLAAPSIFTSDAEPGKRYEGLSLKADESGWGLHLAHQGSPLFATWFTYDRDGSGMWLVMSSGTATTLANSFPGTLYRTRGTAFNVVPWTP